MAPSVYSLGPVRTRVGVSSSQLSLPCSRLFLWSRWTGQRKVMWDPVWGVLSSQGQRGCPVSPM